MGVALSCCCLAMSEPMVLTSNHWTIDDPQDRGERRGGVQRVDNAGEDPVEEKEQQSKLERQKTLISQQDRDFKISTADTTYSQLGGSFESKNSK